MWRHLQLTRGRTATRDHDGPLNLHTAQALVRPFWRPKHSGMISRANSRRSTRRNCFVQLLTHCEQGEGDRALPRQSQLAANEQALREFRAWQDIENAALTAPPPNGFEQKGQFLLVTNSGRWMQVIPRFALKHASSPGAMATG